VSKVQKGVDVACEAARTTAQINRDLVQALNAQSFDDIEANAILLALPAGRFVYASRLFDQANADDLVRPTARLGELVKRVSDDLLAFLDGEDVDPPFQEVGSAARALPGLFKRYEVETCRMSV
jgi:hypothetical protein